MLDTVADLSYTYDQFVDAPAPPTPPEREAGPIQSAARMSQSLSREPELVAGLTAPLELSGQPQRVQLKLNQRAATDALARLSTGTPRILLEIQDIDAERHPGTVYGVYVNLPADAPPDQEPAHHVGNLSFFGVERARDPGGDQQPHGLSLTYDITQLADSERASGHWDDQAITVEFKPLGLIPPEGEEPAGPGAEPEPPATIGSVSIYYA